jgi:hypothetical protein
LENLDNSGLLSLETVCHNREMKNVMQTFGIYKIRTYRPRAVQGDKKILDTASGRGGVRVNNFAPPQSSPLGEDFRCYFKLII